MSRSGYTDDYGDDDPLAHGRWRAAVKSAIYGKRGQTLLRELADAMDGMPDKRLFAGNFATVEGEFCTLGVLGAKRGTKMDDLGSEEMGDCDAAAVGQRFGIAHAMAAEIMFMNDEGLPVKEYLDHDVLLCGPVRPFYPEYGSHVVRFSIPNPRAPEDRWERMRKWVADHLKAVPSPAEAGATSDANRQG